MRSGDPVAGIWTTEATLFDTRKVDATLAAHRISGRHFEAGGIRSFVRDQGLGEPVVLMHGLPMSSFLYRKVIHRLAEQGFRAISFDLPGLGLADRPVDFDYSIRSLGEFASAAIDALGLDQFHLVVHDAGGPIGFQTVLGAPERVLSLTVLNTLLSTDHPPFPGEVYGRFSSRFRGVLASPRLFRELMLRVGIADAHAVGAEEIDVHRRLLLDADEGAAYLRIMRALRQKDVGPWHDVVDRRFAPYPVDVAWGGQDPILSLQRFGFPMLQASHVPWLRVLKAKHYLQEDRADEVAAVIAGNAKRANQPTAIEENR
jgi:pimeloyl-ACP methyl ester carboxylesterase